MKAYMCKLALWLCLLMPVAAVYAQTTDAKGQAAVDTRPRVSTNKKTAVAVQAGATGNPVFVNGIIWNNILYGGAPVIRLNPGISHKHTLWESDPMFQEIPGFKELHGFDGMFLPYHPDALNTGTMSYYDPLSDTLDLLGKRRWVCLPDFGAFERQDMDLPGLDIVTVAPVCEGSPLTELKYDNVVHNPTSFVVRFPDEWSGSNMSGTSAFDGEPLQIRVPGGMPVGSYACVLVVRAAAECENQYPFTLEVRPVVAPSAVLSLAGPSTLCKGENARLEISFTGEGPYEYQLEGETMTRTFGGFDADGNPLTSTVIEVKADQTTDYRLVSVRQASGCGGEGTVSGEARVEVLALPEVMLSAASSVCEDELAPLTLKFSGVAPFVYQINGGPEQVVWGHQDTVWVNGGDTYTVSSLTAGGCAFDAALAAGVTIEENKLPVFGPWWANEVTGDAGAYLVTAGMSAPDPADKTIEITAPAVTSVDAVLSEGWLLDGVPITLPYKVLDIDRNKLLMYTATNSCGNAVTTRGVRLKTSSVLLELTVSGTEVTKSRVYDKTTLAEVTAAGTLSGVKPPLPDVTVAATANYYTATVGDSKTILVKYTLSGADAGDYLPPASELISDGEIRRRQLSVNDNAVDDKLYDGTIYASMSTGALENRIEGDQVYLNLMAAFGQKDAGNNLAVTVSNVRLGGAQSNNYLAPVLPSDLTASILKKPLVVTGTKLETEKAWDGTREARLTAVGTLTGVVTGETVGLEASAFYDQADPGTDIRIRVDYRLMGEPPVLANYEAPPYDDSFRGAIYKAPEIENIAVPEAICAGMTLVLTDPAVDDPDGEVLRSWWTLDGVELATRTPRLTAADHGKLLRYNIQTARVTAYSNEVAVTVNALPAVKVSGGGSVCAPGDEAMVKVQFTAGEAPFTWYMNGDEEPRVLAAGNVEYITVVPSELTTYRVTSVTDANGCVATEPGNSVTVSPGVKPTAVISGGDVICAGGSATVRIDFTGPAPYYYRLTGDVEDRVATASTVWTTVTPEPDPMGKNVYTVRYQVESLEANGCLADVAVDVTGEGLVTVHNVVVGELNGTLTVNTGDLIDPPAPEVKGVDGAGYWYLNGKEITMPYIVKNSDNGAWLTYRVVNPCGDYIESDGHLGIEVVDGLPVLTVSGTEVNREKVYDGGVAATVTTTGALAGVAGGETVTLAASAEYINASVGVGKMITVYYDLSGADASKYAAPAPLAVESGRINPLQLTVAAPVAGNKVYDGLTAASVMPGALNGVLPADEGSVSVFAQAQFASKTVGPNKTVNVRYELTGTGIGNYLPPADATTQADITARDIRVVGTEVTTTKIYDGNATADVISKGYTEGVIAGDVVEYDVIASYDVADAGTGRTITVGYQPVAAGDALNYRWPADYTIAEAVIIGLPRVGNITGPGALCAGAEINLPAPDPDGNGGTLVDNGHWILGNTEIRMPYRVDITDNGKILKYKVQNEAGPGYSNEVVLAVHRLPGVELTGDAICTAGGKANVTLTFSGVAPFTYSLSDGTSGTVAAGTTAVAEVMPATTTVYRVTHLSDAHCRVENPEASATVSVGDRPTAVISGNALICAGGEAEIRIDFTGEAPYSYRLAGDTEDRVAEVSPALVKVSPLVTTTYALERAATASCTVAADALKGEARVTVNEAPVVAISGDVTVCSGNPVELTLKFSGGTGEYVYRLTGDTGNRYFAGAQTTVTVNPGTTTVYTVDTLASGACGGLTGSGSATVTRPELPTVGTLAALPAFTLPAILNIEVPAVTNAARGQWLLGAVEITMPYTLGDADNGKKLRYVVWNECGDRAESNRVTVSIPDSPVRPLAVEGTELETERVYNGGTDVRVLAAGRLVPQPAGDVTLQVDAVFIGTPHAGEKQIDVVYTLTGADAAKYTAPQAGGLIAGRITPLPLVMSDPIVVKTKEYDRTTRVVPAVRGGKPQNLLAGDVLKVEALAAYNTHMAGENRKILVNYNLSGISATDYTQPDDFVVTDAVIVPKVLTAGVPSLVKVKTYDGKRDADVTGGTLSGLIPGDEVRSLALALYDNRNAGVNKTITVMYALEGADKDNYSNVSDYAAADGEINRLQLGAEGTEVALAKTYDGTVTATVTNVGRLTNAIFSDDVELKVRAEYDSPAIGDGKAITVTYSLAGADAANYLVPAGYTLPNGVISNCPVIGEPVVPALCEGSLLTLARPDVEMNGSVQEGNGWWTMNNEVLTLPYVVSNADNGAELKYHIRTLACGVVSSAGVALTVHKLPVVNLSGAHTICGGVIGENPDLLLTVMGGQAPYTYRLTGNSSDMTAPNRGNNIIRVSRPSNTTRYEVLWLKDQNGCRAADISGEAVVKVVPKPAVSLSGGGAICKGESAVVVVNFTGEAPFTFAINGGEVRTTFAMREEITVTPETDTEYKVTSFSSFGSCEMDPVDLLAVPGVKVKVNRLPQIEELAFDNCLTLGTPLTVPVPAITDALRQGWTLNGNVVTLPHTVETDDHGKTLRLWAENRCGRSESNGVQLLVKGNTDQVLLVKGVSVKEKIYDGTIDGEADMTNIQVFGQIMDDSDCSLTEGVDLTATLKDKLKPVVRFDQPNAGDGHKVTIRYEFTEPVPGYVLPKDEELTNGVITKRPLTVAEPVLVASRAYDATTHARVTAGGLTSDVVAGDEVKVAATAAYRDKNAAENKPVDVTYAVNGKSAGNYELAASVPSVYTAAITPIPLSVVGEQIQPDRKYIAGDRSAVVTRQGTVGGVIAGDKVQVYTQAEYDSDAVGQRMIKVGFAHDELAADKGNYTLPSAYQRSGVIYDKPQYTTPLEGIGDILCVGTTLSPKAPDYVLNEAPVVSAGWTITRNGVSSPFVVPYRVSAEDDGAELRYVVRNSAGYADNVEGMNMKLLVVNDKPVVAKTLVALPAIEQMTELVLPVAPVVTGGAVDEGWALVTGDQDIATAEKLVLPYTVRMEDNGKYLVYWAENDCGRSASNRVALNVFKAYPVQLSVKVIYVQTKKKYDGTTAIGEDVIFTVSGIEAGHDLKLLPTAVYDTPVPGENKQITISFALTGADADKYAPVADVVRNDGLIFNVPFIEPLGVPDALCAGTWLDVPQPVVTDNAAPILKKGWSLNGVTIPMPYRVEAADSAKVLTFWAVNTVGITETDGVEITVKDRPEVELLDVTEFPLNLGDTLRELPVPVVRSHGYEVSDQAWYINGTRLEMPYHISIDDLGAKLAYRATNACGETIGADVPVKLILTTGAPIIAALPVPDYICAGDTLKMEVPEVDPFEADVIVSQGWKLNGESVRLPLQLDVEDNGSLLTYFATNEYGASETQPVVVTVRPRPAVTMPKDTVINIGGSVIVTYQFSGTAPFSYTLKDGETGTTSPDQYALVTQMNPEHAHYYGVRELSDKYCQAWPVDLVDSMLVQINGDKIRIMVGDTVFVYDGSFKELEVLADPADRTDSLKIYYDGSTARPYLPGSYPTVVKFGGDWQYGPLEKQVTVIIEKAYADVLISNLRHLYDGRPKQADVTTDPEGLKLKVTYDDTTKLPVASGQYRVYAEVQDGLWQGSADGLLVIDEFTQKAEMINTIEVRGNNNTKFLIKDFDRYTNVRVMMFDKGGTLIYKSEDYYNDFDMRDLRAGTYYYVLKYKNEGRDETKRGAVTVIK